MTILEFINKEIDSFINESQTFNFDKYKKEIFKFIDKIKSGENLTEFDNPFYSIIAGDVKFTNLFDNNIKNKWKEYFTSKSFITDGVWSQRNFNKNIQRKTGENRTLNYYITIDKDENNILKFWNSLGLLDKMLSDLSNSKQEPISYKTHRLLDAFITHNDSLKIYYYNPNLKTDIENIVNSWLNKSNVKKSDRTHTFGVDVKGSGSYGQILSNTIGKQFIDLVKKYGDKYSNEQYYEWIKKYMPTLIQNIKPKEV